MNNVDFATLEANLMLDHVRQYLGKQTFNGDGKGVTFKQYIAMKFAADVIIKAAQAEVNQPVIVVVDEAEYARILSRLAFKVLKASIEDENVVTLLPFTTSLELGATYNHILNESLYDVETQHHVISRGDTLCARGASSRGSVIFGKATCPGCITKAKGVIINHLLDQADGDYLRVAQVLKTLQGE